jgi:hypothetical protein
MSKSIIVNIWLKTLISIEDDEIIVFIFRANYNHWITASNIDTLKSKLLKVFYQIGKNKIIFIHSKRLRELVTFFNLKI